MSGHFTAVDLDAVLDEFEFHQDQAEKKSEASTTSASSSAAASSFFSPENEDLPTIISEETTTTATPPLKVEVVEVQQEKDGRLPPPPRYDEPYVETKMDKTPTPTWTNGDTNGVGEEPKAEEEEEEIEVDKQPDEAEPEDADNTTLDQEPEPETVTQGTSADISPPFESIYDKYQTNDAASSATNSSESSSLSSSESSSSSTLQRESEVQGASATTPAISFETPNISEEEMSRLVEEELQEDESESATASATATATATTETGTRPKASPPPPDSPPPYSEIDPMKDESSRPNRPTSLAILQPRRPLFKEEETSREIQNVENATTSEITQNETSNDDTSSVTDAVIGPPGSTPANPNPNKIGLPDLLLGLSEDQLMLGKVSPWWVPDAEAPSCMICEAKFTMTKRRHHCRACGKVLCNGCCSEKFTLPYMDNKEARVCKPCRGILERLKKVEQMSQDSARNSSALTMTTTTTTTTSTIGTGTMTAAASDASAVSQQTAASRPPNPANPMEYCSTIPPLQQAAAASETGGAAAPPSVMVPVGVLKRWDGSSPDHRGGGGGGGRNLTAESKQVMFSDGIRPGGDLAELDGSPDYRRPLSRRSGSGSSSGRSGGRRSSRRSNPGGGGGGLAGQSDIARSMLPHEGLPYISGVGPGNPEQMAESFVLGKSITFSLNRNLRVYVKQLYYAPANSHIWNYRTQGLTSVGQDEIVFLLVKPEGETLPPRDIFEHIQELYEQAGRGNPVGEMGHSVITSGKEFLGGRDYGGFLYLRHTFQCIQNLDVPPEPPFLFAILLTKWEVPWARVFPLRLMLRLGAECRYYPSPLWSLRGRETVYRQIGNTIMKLLSDFTNFTYTLPIIKGLVIHMEDKLTTVLLPKNRYKLVQRALQNSNDPVLALGANFSATADSHLVAVQRDDDQPPKNPMSSSDYETQSINILNRPRKVTGASFIVFNGALKSSSGLTAKSSIVEDGLMVQVSQDKMMEIRKALSNMANYEIGCGPIDSAEKPDETVSIKWVEDDKTINIGIKSPIDNAPMDGITSIRIHSGPDFITGRHLIRWTEIFFISMDETGINVMEDPSKIAETLAKSICQALLPHIKSLRNSATQLAVRVSLDPENVGYEAGAKGKPLTPECMNSLDNELIPLIHGQSMTKTTLELIFHILDA